MHALTNRVGRSVMQASCWFCSYKLFALLLQVLPFSKHGMPGGAYNTCAENESDL